MNREERMVFMITQCLCAFAEIQGMLALNQERISQGYALGYDEAAFLSVIEKYGLGSNQVIGFLRD